MRLSPDEQHREQRLYLFPPLWGAESFNDGAGMARNIAAAWFVRANMPKGVTFADPVLSPEDAYDVAAYINASRGRTRPTSTRIIPTAGSNRPMPRFRHCWVRSRRSSTRSGHGRRSSNG